MKQNVYDNQFGNEYDKMRFDNKGFTANDLIEIPNFRKMMPKVKNKTILDLGCGYGEEELFYSKDAKYILGTDISEHMIDYALKNNKADNIDYQVLAMEDLELLNKKFDIVISSLAFHYIKDFDNLIKKIYNILNEDGYLIFSQEHPLVTSIIYTDKMLCSNIELDKKKYYLISDYNNIGLRDNKWMGEVVIKYHRNFSTIINTLINNGFEIDEILEPVASEEAIKKVPKYANQFDRPYFLMIRAKKRLD